jgi:hypothetical protein
VIWSSELTVPYLLFARPHWPVTGSDGRRLPGQAEPTTAVSAVLCSFEICEARGVGWATGVAYGCLLHWPFSETANMNGKLESMKLDVCNKRPVVNASVNQVLYAMGNNLWKLSSPPQPLPTRLTSRVNQLYLPHRERRVLFHAGSGRYDRIGKLTCANVFLAVRSSFRSGSANLLTSER